MIDINKMKVLIVDDMENMCKSIRNMMKILKFGSSYTLCYNGELALKAMRQKDFDLAIMDWNMPKMKGIEVLEHIRNDKKFRDMPVIMITAESNKEIVAEAAESDIDAYILKPLTVKSLENKVKGVIERYNNPPEFMLLLKKSRELSEKGEIDSAIETAKKAIVAEPKSSRPVRVLGSLFYEKNDILNAEKCFLRAAKMNRLDVFAYHHLGEIYLKKNDLEKAGKFFERAMKISPRHCQRAFNFAKILLSNNNISKAKPLFNKVFELAEDPVSQKEEVAFLYLKYKHYEDSLELLEELEGHYPERIDILLTIARIYNNFKQPGKVIDYSNKILRLEHDNFEANLLIAKSYMKIKQVMRADEILRKLEKLMPENEEVKQLLKMNA
ncbi:MAG: response regulator [Desulfobacteraceae bacterium]|nr:response regulator [Desulfobacteraceae bacterium]